MRGLILMITAILISAPTVCADDLDETRAIVNTATNYMEAWYEGNAGQMEASLHKDLAKRRVITKDGHQNDLRLITASEMVSYTSSGYGKRLWSDHTEIDVILLDFHKNIASVKVVTPHYYEYLHLMRKANKWVIVNTIYERK
jgi:hypothetical protein